MLVTPWWHMPIQWSLSTIGGIILITVLLSLTLTKSKARVTKEQ